MVNSKFFIIFLLFSSLLQAQKENYNWIFGNKAGLTWNKLQTYTGKDYFNTSGGDVTLEGIPTALTSEISTSEGCFNVSDYDGELLFYSDGVSVWEKKIGGDVVISNGTGLTGNSSSVQSGIILPYPGNASSYIAVTLNTKDGLNSPITKEELQKYLSWSAIVKNPETNRYEIPEEKKNIALIPPEDQFYKEIVTGVRHSNKKDFWIITPSRKIDNTATRNYYKLSVYKVDEKGVSSQPILQQNDLSYVQTNIVTHFTSYGQVKLNKSGTRLAMVTHNRNESNKVYNNLLIADFNSETGKISNLHERSIGVTNEQIYSIEFDPSEQYVYITSLGSAPPAVADNRKYTLYVFKVSDLIDPKINTSELIDYGIKSMGSGGVNEYFGSISTGVDDKMYITNNSTRHLFVIPEPKNPTIPLKIYRLDNILSTGTTARLGLPSYASVYFNVNMNDVNICKNTQTIFTINISGGEGGDNYLKTVIDYGDQSELVTLPNEGLNKSYTLTHQYSNDGSYKISMTSYDKQNRKIDASSSELQATVSSCQIKVNPHIRINM